MSHFSVCVIVPDDGVVNNIHANNLEDHLIPVLAPFDEQTEEEKYREFEDRTEEAKADFENDTMRVVRFPDGSTVAREVQTGESVPIVHEMVVANPHIWLDIIRMMVYY